MENCIDVLCNSLNVTLLREVLRAVGSREELSTKEELATALKREIRDIGIENITVTFSDDTIRECLKVIRPQNENAESTEFEKEEALETIATKMKADGFESFFSSLPESTFNSISFDIGMKPKIHKNNTEEKIKQRRQKMVVLLREEVLLTGLESFFSLLTLPSVKKIAQIWNLSKTGRKQELVERLVQHTITLAKNITSTPTPSSTTPPSTTTTSEVTSSNASSSAQTTDTSSNEPADESKDQSKEGTNDITEDQNHDADKITSDKIQQTAPATADAKDTSHATQKKMKKVRVVDAPEEADKENRPSIANQLRSRPSISKRKGTPPRLRMQAIMSPIAPIPIQSLEASASEDDVDHEEEGEVVEPLENESLSASVAQ